MNRRSVDDWLSDILHWGKRIEAHLQNVEWTDFLKSLVLQDAISKCLEAIGEAAGKLDHLDPEFSRLHFGDQLKYARRSRDRLTHGYYDIDLSIMWQTATVSTPKLVAAAKEAQLERHPKR